jgi:hypothetical protein
VSGITPSYLRTQWRARHERGEADGVYVEIYDAALGKELGRAAEVSEAKSVLVLKGPISVCTMRVWW